MMRMHVVTATVATAALLGGCSVGPAVGPEYERPALSLPLQWIGLGSDTSLVDNAEAAKNDADWWQIFGDDTLNGLMTQALERNGDLRMAQAAVAEARGARLAANAALLPAIDGVVQGARGDNNASGSLGNSGSAGFDASWEIDLFGGNRRAAQAARARLGGAVAEAEFTRISLLAEVANSYLSTRMLQQQLEIARQNLSDQQETLRLVEAQFKEGVVNGLVVAQNRAQAASTAAQIPQLEANLKATQNALGVLVGSQPAEIEATLGGVRPVPVATPKVLVDAPASVIAKRPDVAAAERALQAAVAEQGAAMATWFPKVSLTGFFGISDYGNGNGSEGWNIGGVVRLPMIDFGTVRALTRQANARQQSALANYEQVVLNAVADVETRLSAYVKAVEAAGLLKQSADASREAFRLAKLQYTEGVASNLEVLTAEQTKLAAESAEAEGNAAVGQNLAALYKALGGF
jgi:outer membrane protein, multidrug efflux system